MRKQFVAVAEDVPGADWLARFRRGRNEADRWYHRPGVSPTPNEARAALAAHMPELLPHYDHVCGLVGDDPAAHIMLSHWRPPPTEHGCSQTVWLGEDGPALVRNYDFPIATVTGRFERTAWDGIAVIGSAQRPWGGLLDGMNAHGLVASLTAGGSAARGAGFAIILVLRYVLQTCRTVAEGIAAFRRIPIAQSQNVTLLDRSGAFATVFLGLDRTPAISRNPVCTNHQEIAPATGTSAQRFAALQMARNKAARSKT